MRNILIRANSIDLTKIETNVSRIFLANANIHGNIEKVSLCEIKNCEISLFIKFRYFAICGVTQWIYKIVVMHNILWLPGTVRVYILDKPRRERGIMVLETTRGGFIVIHIDIVARLRSKFMQATRLVKTNDRSETIEDPAGAGSIINPKPSDEMRRAWHRVSGDIYARL